MAEKELEEVYHEKSDKYERMVAREDWENNIPAPILGIRDLHGLDVIDTGAGTGRLACMFAPIARTMRAYDVAEEMLKVTRQKLAASGLSNWETAVADHRALPAADASADVILSGWSIVYTVVWEPENWRAELRKALVEMQRVLRPGGTLIILETNGTGYAAPTPPQDLLEYFQYLEADEFTYSWIRTDYKFESMEEGKDLTTFFFGDGIVEKFSSTDPAILPECTGIWWKQF